MLSRRYFGLVASGVLLAAPAIVRAQNFPSGRVTIIVPFPAGASTDITARVYAEGLSQMWGQPVVVDNRGGGNGIPAADVAAHAKPDGLTIFATSAMTQAVNPALYDKLPYDPIADFEAVAGMNLVPFVLLVDRDSPFKSVAELTTRLKAEPGKHNYGAGALPARVASELYKLVADVDVVYVGYKSNPQAFPDLQGGLLTFMMVDLTNAKLAIDRGALKGLVLTHTERSPLLPAIPAAAEVGLADLLLSTWAGFYVPKGTPQEIVHKINADIGTVMADRVLGARLETLSGKPKLTSPEEFAAFTRSEKERWGKIIHRANIKVE